MEGGMFAMLGGAAWGGGDPAEVVAAQVGAGLEVVTDGRRSVPEGLEAARLVDDLVAGRGIGSVEGWVASVAVAPTAAVAVAAALPGPYSLARAAEPGAAASAAADLALLRALADALAREAGALGAAGCPLARVDEPDAFAPATDDAERAAFVVAHRSLVAGAASEVAATHLMLALTGGDHEGIGAATLAGLGYASYLFDLIAGPTDWRLVAALPEERGIVCGVVDAATSAGDAPEVLVWAAHYAASTRRRGLARVGLATTGSLAALDRDAAVAKMRALGEGARIAALPADEIRASLDPRAIDMRSAALGVWSADPGLLRRPRV
jgi:hypothetical protein